MKDLSTSLSLALRLVCLMGVSLLNSTAVSAQLQLSNGSAAAVIDFSSATQSSVGTNPGSAITGSGFSPNPTTAGLLNSNAWAVAGWSNGNLAFGGTQTTVNTDYTRGSTAVAVTSGGMYAFTGAPHSVTNPCLMLQPGGSDWAPGTMSLRIQNTGTTNITSLAISYNLYVRNDQGRSNSFNFSHSPDDITYSSVPALDYISTAVADALGWVQVGASPSRSTVISGISVAPGAYYYIRWSGADVSGAGSRDEFGLDDITVSATYSCGITSSGLTGIQCFDNGTPALGTDDIIRFTLDPSGISLGATYSVTASGSQTIVKDSDGSPATGIPYGSPVVFRVLPAGSAGAGNVQITVTDVSGGCSVQSTITDPGPCSNAALPCDLNINSVTFTNQSCTSGSLTVNATCGNCTGPLSYSIDNTNWQASSTFTGLAPGTYTVRARDISYPIACNDSEQAVLPPFDNVPPVFNTPLPQNFSIECGLTIPPAPNVTATDLIDSTVTVTLVTTTIAGTCPQEYQLVRTWTATDDCNNTAVYTQTVTVTDDTAPVFNQSLPQSYTAYCGNTLPMPQVLSGSDNCDPGVSPAVIFINEVHYDNVGTDVNEFIEVAGTAGTDLSQYNIVLYNGAGGTQYGTLILSGTIDNEGNGFGSVAFPYPVNGLQNGAPDGFALATNSGMVIQFLSYEGSFTAVGGIADGMVSTDIGVLEDGLNPVGTSLQLTGTGAQYSNFTWVGPVAASPGTLNAGQQINALPGVIPAAFNQTVQFGSCDGESVVTRTWTITDACGNARAHTQTITLSDNQGPAFVPPLPQNITINCQDIVPPPATLLAADACDMGNMMQRVWINEIHYDNVGADVAEAIEIAGTAGVNLSEYALVLYNGSGGAVYDTDVLSGLIPNQSNGFGTVCVPYPLNGLQNGSPDGVALVHNVMGGMVVQFLSYEGTFVATGGPAVGMTSVDIGVLEDGFNLAGTSVRLVGNGDEYADFTWAAPDASSCGSVNQGQTFIPVSTGPTVSFNQSVAPGVCVHERTITRTWTAQDDCGNVNTYTQVISVVDDTAPVLTCPANVTVNLNIQGNASVSTGSLNITATDNCSPVAAVSVANLTYTFDCDDDGTTIPVQFSATDECANTGFCTVNVTVNPYPRCTPVISITDPCVCKNNATTLTNGQFSETIRVQSLSGKTWSVFAVSGLFAANSAAPPAAPTPVLFGTVLTENPVGSGDYYLSGVHVDAVGYSITVRSEMGETLTIGNKCEYPNPTILSNLNGPFCLFSDQVALTGNPGDANIVSQGFTINGTPATIFNPAQGVGTYVIEYTVNGGAPKASGPDDPGCIQKVSKTVEVLATPDVLICNDLVHVSIDADCQATVMPDDVLEGTYGCYDDYFVEIDRLLPYGNGPWGSSVVTSADINQTYQYRVTHKVSGNFCWGYVNLEDKLEPVVSCADITLFCPITRYEPSYLRNTLGIATALPTIVDCDNTTTEYIDTWHDLSCGEGYNGVADLSAYVDRKWTVTDATGNSTVCVQHLYFKRLHLADLTLPSIDVNLSCSNANTSPAATGTPSVTAFGRRWDLFPDPGFCELQISYTDQVLPVCDGTSKMIRKWTVLDGCAPVSASNPLYHTQVINILDQAGPAMICPANMTVSTDPEGCCAFVDMPDIVIEDACSRVFGITGMVTTFEKYTGVQTGMVAFDGNLSDFPTNNYWDLDTMAMFGITPCLPEGSHVVTYTAQDNCGNTSSCTFRLKVEDLVPPNPACDEVTQVAVTGNGQAIVDAINFDNGSFDYCSPILDFKVRRGTSSAFGDDVRFTCSDINNTITITLRVYDLDVPNGSIQPDAFENHYNDCVISVLVEDKIKPVCAPPAHVTVTCEQFDPTLVLYGKASVSDNCCLDGTKTYLGQKGLVHTASYTTFDTLCNKGTIVRTFRVYDCHGNTSQCTQRIVVNYEQDYFVRFPDDKIVSVCDGTGDYGEPTFYGEDCELLGVTYEDFIFTVVPDACYKIERNWKVINWCTFNPQGNCINVPNPNPNAITNHPTNLPGPIVSPVQLAGDPWKSTIVKINPTDAAATNYSVYYDANANCYTYKQIIKIIDTQDPVAQCPASPVTICDITPNDAALWNQMYWWDLANSTHDLGDAPSDISLTASDACSGSNINFEYQLLLDLDGDGSMETVVNSTQLGSQPGGLGWNNVLYNNVNVTGGISRQFDNRPVAPNQKWGFALQETVSGNTKTASVKFNTQQAQNTYVTPQLPYGTHKIKWFITDGCGNEAICEYTIIIKDCKAPTVVCFNGLSVNIMPTGMITMNDVDFLEYTVDNYSQTQFLRTGIRKCGTGSGFPFDANGNPIKTVTFNCSEVGTQCVELWSIDIAGNADYCETYVIVQDNNGNCPNSDKINVSGALKTEDTNGVEEGNVTIEGTSTFTPPFSYFDLSDNTGVFSVNNSVPVASTMTITPVKDDNPLNGVTTYDLVLISKHILGIEPLNTPYKMIAADANKSNSITTFDIVELRKLILGIYTELPNNTSWRFIDKSQQFANPTNPFTAPLKENISVANALANMTTENFVGVKVGDVNGTAVANSAMVADDRTTGTLLFDVQDRDVKAGEVFDVTFKASDKAQGYQMTLNLNGLSVAGIVKSDAVNENNFGIFADALTVSVDGSETFTVTFKAEKAGKLSRLLKISSRITKAEAYSLKNERFDVALRFSGETVSGVGFELYQNQPNPFVGKTAISFHLVEAGEAVLTVYDEAGRALYTQRGDFERGYNTIILDRALIDESGILYYTLVAGENAATKKMIQIR